MFSRRSIDAICSSPLVRPACASTRNKTRFDALHRKLDLMLDVIRQPLVIEESVSAGIDDFDESTVDLQVSGDAVTRYPGHVLHDADLLARHGIQQRRLPDIRATDNGDNRQWHTRTTVGARQRIVKESGVYRSFRPAIAPGVFAIAG